MMRAGALLFLFILLVVRGSKAVPELDHDAIDVNTDVYILIERSPAGCDGEGHLSGELHQDTVHLHWDGLKYHITLEDKTEKTLLMDLGGDVFPGEMVAIVGGSGSGKTSLLNVLAHRIASGRVEGTVLVNGRKRAKKTWHKMVAYVEQEDLLLPILTVRETLRFQAELRLPNSMSQDAKFARVEKLICSLGLGKCADTVIGQVHVNRGISGGERKRISIGEAEISDPQVMFLDEPSSGLDSFTSFTVIDSIRTLATAKKKTILCTIHQPRVEIIELFDHILLMSNGKCVFFGTIAMCHEHFRKVGFECPLHMNAADFFVDKSTIDFRSPERQIQSSEGIEKLLEVWRREGTSSYRGTDRHIRTRAQLWSPRSEPSEIECDTDDGDIVWPNTMLQETAILMRRDLLIVLRDRAYNFGQTMKFAVMTPIIAVLFWQLASNGEHSSVQNRLGVAFLLLLNQLLNAIFPPLVTLPIMMPLLRRERASAVYRPLSAYISKSIVLMLVPLSFTVFTSTIIYFASDLRHGAGHFFVFLMVSMMMTVSATLMGLCFGSFASSSSISAAIGSLIIFINMAIGGQVINLSAVPAWLNWIKYFNILWYADNAIAHNEFDGMRYVCPVSSSSCVQTSGELYDAFGLEKLTLGENMAGIIGNSIIYFFLGLIFFIRNTRPTHINMQ